MPSINFSINGRKLQKKEKKQEKRREEKRREEGWRREMSFLFVGLFKFFWGDIVAVFFLS